MCVVAHSQRLVSVQSMLRQAGRYRTLERDLMELQERKLFEYFIVVALHKTKAGVPYLPEVTQQFPLKVKWDETVIEAFHFKMRHLPLEKCLTKFPLQYFNLSRCTVLPTTTDGQNTISGIG